MIDGFAEVVKEACSLCRHGVEAELGGHHAAKVGDFEGVVENVLAVGGAIAQATEDLLDLGMEIVDAGIERGLGGSFLDLLVHVTLRLIEHLFDAGGMDAAIADEILHGDARDLATHGVMRGNGYAFGGVIDDEVRAGDLLERADVAAFTTDDASLQIVRGDMDRGNGDLRGVVRGKALNRDAQDLASLLVGLGAGTVLGIADDGGGLVHAFIFEVIEEFGFRLLGRQAGNAFESLIDLGFGSLNIAHATIDLPLEGGNLVLALIKGFDALVEVLLALVEMVFRRAYLAHALFAFAFSVLLDLEGVVLGFDDSLFLQVLGLAFRVGEGEFCFIGRCVVTILQDFLHEKVTYRETDNDRYDGSDDDLDHSIPFRSSCISRYER